MKPPSDSEDFLKTGGALDSGLGASAFGAGEASPLIGKLIGNVRITRFIGAGGMGEVFLGLDERLDRKVAVKTLRPGTHVSEMAVERFRREARILSRLDHPSICRLYDLVNLGEQPFLLLEYLEGRSPAEAGEKLGENEILEIGTQVARALAAAHREGIIHRDLKPDNIMLMKDRRVKILDFGIGRFMEEIQPVGAGEPPPESPGRKPTGATPTIRGAIIGTPRYMSPEQARGEALTPATDLYSFGILLYELLEGRSPYQATDPLSLILEIPEAKLGPPPSASPALQKLIMSLLEKDPLQRPTALETAAELELIREAPRRRRRRIIAASLVSLALLAVLGALIGGRILGEGRYRCRGQESHLEGIWDPAVRTKLASSYRKAGLEGDWKLLDEVLANYADQWIQQRRRACEATWVLKEQTPELLELENACLDRRLQSLAALVSVLSDRPETTARRAVLAAHALPGMAGCFNLESLRSRIPLPENEETRKKLISLRAQITRARALYDTGKYPEGMSILESLESGVQGIAYPPLSAEFDYIRGLLLEKLGKLVESDQILKAAVLEAEAGRDDRRAARAWVRRVWIEGSRLSDFEHVDESVEFARAAIKRLGGDPELEGALANHRGVLTMLRGNPQEALDFYLEALRLRRQAFGPEHPKVASTLQNCANLYEDLGEREKALEMGEQALQMQRRLLGPTHPSVYVSLVGVSSILRKLGRNEEAQKLQDEAIVLAEETYPSDHPEIGVLKSNLAAQALHARQSLRARQLATEAITILEKNPGPEALFTGNAVLNLTMACEQLEDWDAVIRNAQKELPIFEKLLGPEDESCLKLKASLGLALLKTGRAKEARPPLLSALKVLEKEQHPSSLRCILRFRFAQVAMLTTPKRAVEQARLALSEIQLLKDPSLEDFDAQIRDWLRHHTLPH